MNTAVGSNVFTLSPLPTKGVTLFDCLPGYSYQIFSDKDLMTTYRTAWTGARYDRTNPQSINNVISHVDSTGLYNRLNPFVTGFINTLPYESIYITSNQLSTFENVGPAGQ